MALKAKHRAGRAPRPNDYNFVGGFNSRGAVPFVPLTLRRSWVVPFALRHFTNASVFANTSAQGDILLELNRKNDGAAVAERPPDATTAPVWPENMIWARSLSVALVTCTGSCSPPSLWPSSCSSPAVAARPNEGKTRRIGMQ